jgi:hypothetical protein
MIVDSDSGFGGYGAEVVHYLRDDFGSKSVALFPTFPSHVSGDQKTNNLVLLPISSLIHSVQNAIFYFNYWGRLTLTFL